MDLERFQIYEQDGKKGILDIKLNKVIMDSKFDVESFNGDAILLKNGKSILLRNVLENYDYFTAKVRYFVVENEKTKLVGIYDSKFKELKVFCGCEKIEYSPKDRAFFVTKNGATKKMPYEKLRYLKYHPPKVEEVITLNNLTLYYGKQISVNSKTGKKVEINR